MLISMAGEGAVLVAENGQVFEKPAPKGRLVNGVGAGDSMVAGFVWQAGWKNRITNMHSIWEFQQEVQVHFLKILHRKEEIEGFISHEKK